MTDPVKEIKESLENQLKEGFSGLQKKYDAAIADIEKGNTVATDLKGQIEIAKGEIEHVIVQVH